MNTQMNLQRIPVNRLKPAKYNPRKDLKPGDPAYEKIRRSLHDFGYVDPVIWNEVTGNIVGGHQRYKVLVNEGATEIDCVVVHIENPQDEKALNIEMCIRDSCWTASCEARRRQSACPSRRTLTRRAKSTAPTAGWCAWALPGLHTRSCGIR